MARCECLGGCPFFNDRMANMPSTADLIKKRYCLSDNSECARHMVFRTKGKGSVPGDLSPCQHDRAREMLAA